MLLAFIPKGHKFRLSGKACLSTQLSFIPSLYSELHYE